MPILPSKEKRKTYWIRITGFWEEYRRTRIGVVALILLVFYVLTALLAPWLTPYDPTRTKRIAESFAAPSWTTYFPGRSDLPRTMSIPLRWTIEESPIPTAEGGAQISVSYDGGSVQPITLKCTASFSYPYTPPETFNIQIRATAQNVKDLSYLIELYIIDTNGTQTRLAPMKPITGEKDKTFYLELQSTDYYIVKALGYPEHTRIAEIIFSQPGTYKLMVKITLTPHTPTSTINLVIKDTIFNIPGLVHGLLGCDNEGRDIFSQLVYGARISLAIGIAAALIGTSFGLIFGVVAGYVGGAVDEIIMRIVDVLLCLPVLPLLLALVFMFGPSVIYIVVLIAIFGWQGLSRLIRSQILSLREMPFIECATASGGSKTYIMLRHLIPNVLPIAFASLVLSVPGAILTEASLSFLGFGDPGTPTWGRMLHSAFSFGAFSNFAWWWILPPGLAILFICLAFAFMGHAVDNVINPKLRRRR